MSFANDMLKIVKNEYASIVDDGIRAGDVTGWIDSGSYMLNALLSGSIYKGYPDSKITLLGSPSGVGKTFLVLSSMRTFLESNPKGAIFLFESESALTRQMMVDFGIDVKRVIIFPVITVEEFRHQIITIINKYIEDKETIPILFALDSLGNLSTNKEVGDITEGKDTRDMTRAQLIKATFRVITLKLGRANCSLLVTNHVYQEMGLFSKSVQSGGCLAEGTLIHANGSLKPINEVEIDDTIMTKDGLGKCMETHYFLNKDIYEIAFEDGTVIKCSADHKFLGENGKWISASSLVADTDIKCI